jgi:hypothetical protein
VGRSLPEKQRFFINTLSSVLRFAALAKVLPLPQVGG